MKRTIVILLLMILVCSLFISCASTINTEIDEKMDANGNVVSRIYRVQGEQVDFDSYMQATTAASIETIKNVTVASFVISIATSILSLFAF